MLSLKKSLVVFVSLFSFAACKDQTQVKEIKDYRLYVSTNDPELKAVIAELAAEFNNDVGGEALKIVDSRSESNSTITFVKDLQDEHGSKLGLGQWIASEESKNSFALTGTTTKVTVRRTMALEFDIDNFKEKIAEGIADKSSDAYKHLYHLFCHEVGHGLELDHDSHRTSVMYKSIPDRYTRVIDFSNYFSYVRGYMSMGYSDNELR